MRNGDEAPSPSSRARKLKHGAEDGDRDDEDNDANPHDQGRLKESEEARQRRFVCLAAARGGLVEHFA